MLTRLAWGVTELDWGYLCNLPQAGTGGLSRVRVPLSLRKGVVILSTRAVIGHHGVTEQNGVSALWVRMWIVADHQD